MYSLDINFLNDRPEYTSRGGSSGPRSVGSGVAMPTGNTPLILGAVVGIFFPALIGGAWWLIQNQNVALETEQRQLESKLNDLKAKLEEVNTITAETNAINTETQALASVFNQIKPWSATLQDIRERIPVGVQIASIQEADQGKLTLTGIARSYNEVNDLVLTLQKSPFLKAKETYLVTTALGNNPVSLEVQEPVDDTKPSVAVALPQVATFSVQTSLSDVPASELLRELDSKGAVGLVTRIKTLQEKGVIQQ